MQKNQPFIFSVNIIFFGVSANDVVDHISIEHSLRIFCFNMNFLLLAVYWLFYKHFIMSFIYVEMDILKIRLMLRLVCPVLSIYFLLTNTGGEGYVELFAPHICVPIFLPIAPLKCV